MFRIVSIETLIRSILVLAASIDLPELASAQTEAQVKCHALLIANDVLLGAPIKLQAALLNWASWTAPNGTITVLNNRGGGTILNDIQTWAAGVGPNDVALFVYVGHGGFFGDLNDDETPLTDPVNDNDNVADGRGRIRWVDGSLGLGNNWNANSREDDHFASALNGLPATCTKVAIFNMCYANEACYGTTDPEIVPNLAIINSSSEGNLQRVWQGAAFINGLISLLCDQDGDGFADADSNQDGNLTVGEWALGHMAFSCPQPSSQVWNNVICSGFMNQNNPGSENGDDKKQGVDGCGVCSDPDLGDAPDNGEICHGSSRHYGTTLANDGPRYNEWVLQWLGPVATDSVGRTDAESNGQPGCAADGDGSDEDGVAFDFDHVDVEVSINYVHPLDYRLDAWWDLNDNGIFESPSEHIIVSTSDYDGVGGGRLLDLSGTPATQVFRFDLTFDPRDFYSRFRLTFGVPDTTEISPLGEFTANDGASHGEVEDYPKHSGLGVNYCTANSNSTGAPADISASGSASAAAGDLTLTSAPVPNQNTIFFHGMSQTQVPFGNGFMCTSGDIVRGAVVMALGNVATSTYDNSDSKHGLAGFIGSTRNFQHWFRDPAGGGAFFNTSNAISIAIAP